MHPSARQGSAAATSQNGDEERDRTVRVAHLRPPRPDERRLRRPTAATVRQRGLTSSLVSGPRHAPAKRATATAARATTSTCHLGHGRPVDPGAGARV